MKTPGGRRNADLESVTHQSRSENLDSQWLQGRSVAFVGKLGGITRRQAARIVREAGGTVVDGVNHQADLIVIGADQSPASDYRNLLDDTVLDRATEGLLEIINETEWWVRMGQVEDDDQSVTRRLYTPAMLADLLSVPLSTIRRWHRRNLIRPVVQVHRLPYFDFVEVASARQLARLIANGVSPQVIEARLTRLAGMFPGLRQPLSQLPVIVEGRHVLLRQGGGLVESSGQMRFDFGLMDEQAAEQEDPSEACPDVIGLFSPEDTDQQGPTTAEEYVERAVEYEDQGQIDNAIDTIRQMLIHVGASADGAFRLAELLYSTGNHAAARERYSMAVELAPDFVEARASLGCTLVDLNLNERAIGEFRRTLDFYPDYPDVHFHLARLLDSEARADEAEKHWQEFLRLAPQSPWAAEACERLGLEVVADDEPGE